MKAASLESNGKIKIIEKSIPNIEPDECLIKVVKCGICSSDIYRGFSMGAYSYPLVMGHEFAGKIEKTGKKTKTFSSGDLVGVFPLLPCFKCSACQVEQYATCSNYKYYGSRNNGGFTEYIAVKSWNLFKLDSSTDLSDACLLEPLSVVVHGLKQIGIFSKNNFDNKRVCVIGCGFLGQILIEILINKFQFKEIVILDRNQYKLDRLRINPRLIKQRLNSDREWEDFIKSHNNTFDYTFEMSGYYKNFNRSISLAKPKGKILWLGNIDNDLTVPKNTVSQILRKELNIIGTWNSNFKNKNDDWKDSYELIRQKIVKPSSFITETIKLKSLQSVMEKMYNHKTGLKRYNYIKYLVDLSDD